MKLTTIGLGYIRLPTSIMFAKHVRLGVYVKQEAVDMLNGGQIHRGLDYKIHLKSASLFKRNATEEADAYIGTTPSWK